MFSRIIQTLDDVGPTIIRVMLGIAIFPHGAQKLFGWFGGRGFEATMAGFTEGRGIPAVFVLLLMMAEVFGSLGLIVGFLTRIASFGVTTVMVFVIILNNGRNGFFMNWFGQLPAGNEGFQFQLLAIAMGVMLLIKGAGAFSLDRLLYSKLRGNTSE